MAFTAGAVEAVGFTAGAAGLVGFTAVGVGSTDFPASTAEAAGFMGLLSTVAWPTWGMGGVAMH